MTRYRCKSCGYMGDNELKPCPVCRSTDIVETDSINTKEEAVKLFCFLLDVTPPSHKGKVVKQLMDLLI